MTWTAQATVTDVGLDEDGQTLVEAYVDDQETWTPPHQEHAYPCLMSNTEGHIVSVSVGFVIDGPTSLTVGDRVQVSGHFTGPAPTKEN